MKELERLHTVSPKLADAIKLMTDSQRSDILDQIVLNTFQRLKNNQEFLENLKSLRDTFDNDYFSEEDGEVGLIPFQMARSLSALIEACHQDSYHATLESVYEASMSMEDTLGFLNELEEFIENGQ